MNVKAKDQFQDPTLSSLIMHIDPNLPPGWKRKVVKRSKGCRYDVYILSPAGKRFRSRKQLQEYLATSNKIGLTIDQFSFSLTKDKQGPKHGLTKLMRNSSSLEEKQSSPDISKSQVMSSQTPAQMLTPLNLVMPTQPPATTQLVITYIPPQANMVIKVFDHPPADILKLNQEDQQQEVVGQKSICHNFSDTPKNSDETGKNNSYTKNLIRRMALQTLLPQSDGGNFVDKTGDLVWNETEGREMTELEELDLYYNFDYESDEQEDSIPIRSVFDDDSDEEMCIPNLLEVLALSLPSTACPGTSSQTAWRTSPTVSLLQFKEKASLEV